MKKDYRVKSDNNSLTLTMTLENGKDVSVWGQKERKNNGTLETKKELETRLYKILMEQKNKYYLSK